MQDNDHIFKVLPYEGATTIDMYNKWAKNNFQEILDSDENFYDVIYILSNRPLHDYVKIGVSNNLPARIKQLNVGVPVDFQLEYFAPCIHRFRLRSQGAFSIEGDVHEELKNFRVNKHREFFNVTPEKALSKILKRMMCHGPDKLQYIEHRNLLRYIEHRNL